MANDPGRPNLFVSLLSTFRSLYVLFEKNVHDLNTSLSQLPLVTINVFAFLYHDNHPGFFRPLQNIAARNISALLR
jgi:hypothetical protein